MNDVQKLKMVSSAQSQTSPGQRCPQPARKNSETTFNEP